MALMKRMLILIIALLVFLSRWHFHAQKPAADVTFPASFITNIPHYQLYYILTSNGEYRHNKDPNFVWKHYIWKEMPNGWRVGIHEVWDRPGSIVLYAGSITTNSGPGYIRPPYCKFSKFQLVDSERNIVQPRPEAGTNLVRYYANTFNDQTNVPPWASPTNRSLTVDFPESASAMDFPHSHIGDLAGDYNFRAQKETVGICMFNLNDLYPIINEGDYTLTVQTVLYKCDEPAIYQYTVPYRTNVVLHRFDLPSLTITVHLVPNIKQIRSN